MTTNSDPAIPRLAMMPELETHWAICGHRALVSHGSVDGSGSRDGMYLELWEADVQLLDIYYSNVDGTMTLTAYREDLPLAAVEWAIAEAKVRLPPER